MTKNIFMSYSRRELGFVDDLVSKLEGEGYNVWLDYRVLVPGTSWQEQIYQGIQGADTILLVVSRASIASQNVEVEWKYVIEQNKRIILLVFEAIDLPKELEKYEWVDFRGNYKAALKELLSQLAQPVEEEHPVPKAGFKMPAIVWVAAILSVLAGICSFWALWTLFIPWLLALLPYRIFKRNYNFTQIQAALIILPVALLMTLTATLDKVAASNLTYMLLCSIPMVVILVWVLRSPGMQRWGKEQATLPKFANPYMPNNPNPQPTSFYVDHAPEDRKIANELIQVLKKYGHPQAAIFKEAQTVFVMLSRFKSDTEADPEKQVVFPIILQTNKNISPKLTKVQWIDLRTGVRKLDAIAQLLPEPAKLLKAIGNRPRGNQVVLPAPILAMMYFLLMLGIVSFSSLYKFAFELATSGNITEDAFVDAFASQPYLFVFIVPIGVLIFSMAFSLIRRQGWLASFPKFTIALVILGFLLYWQMILGGRISGTLAASGQNPMGATLAVLFPLLVYLFGGLVMALFLLARRKDVILWFPAKK